MGESGDRSLGKMLVDAGLVDKKQLDEALSYQESIGGKLGRILVKLGFLREDKLLEFVAEQQGLEVVSLKDWEPDKKLMDLAPRDFWEQHGIVPYKLEHSTLTVVMGDASDIPAIDDLRFSTSLEVVPALATNREIQGILNKHFYKDTDRPSHPRQQHTDMREIARELEAKGPVRSEHENLVAEILGANPARLAKALGSLLMKKGVLEPKDVAAELEETS